jgi:hypothetical protein
MKKLLTLSAALLLAWPIASAIAGTDLVKLPENYQFNFVRCVVVDNAKRKKVRFMYVNAEALLAAKAGQPAPNGTVIIMEDRKAKRVAAAATTLPSPVPRGVRRDLGSPAGFARFTAGIFVGSLPKAAPSH